MKVLWFANNACGAISKLTGQSVTAGGWLATLADILSKQHDIELHIAFYWQTQKDSFTLDGIVYHPIVDASSKSKFTRYINRLKRQFSDSYDQVCIPLLLNVVTSVQPDLIHIHGSEANFGLIAKYVMDIPIVLSIQGIVNACYLKTYSGYSRQILLKHESLFFKLLGDGIIANERLFLRSCRREKIIYKNIKNIIGRTSWDKDWSLAMNPQRCYYTVNEILRADFFRAQWSSTYKINKPLCLVSTVTFGLFKGLETIYQTSKILKEAGFNFHWKVIGLDERFDIVRITEKEESVKAEEINVELCGRMSSDKMIDIMTSSDVFIQVSHIENSPNSLCEAMLLGMPVIGTFVGGTSSMLKHGEEGTLIQDGDPYSMAGAIISIANNFSEAKIMGEKARKTAIERHKPENVLKELLFTYKDIVG